MAATRLDYSLFSQPYSPTKADITSLLFPVWTVANLGDIDHDVNVTDKFAGRQVYDVATGLLYIADGPAANDTWTLIDGVGSTQTTPS